MSGRFTLASIVTGFGIAIMQPGMPTLVRNWLPGRVGLGTVAYSNGMVVGATLPPILTLPLVLPWSAARGGLILSYGRCRPLSWWWCFCF